MKEKSKARIRPARPGDVETVARLWQQMMDFHLTFDHRFAVVADSEAICSRYARSVLDRSDYRLLVAETDGQVMAYTLGIILANPEMFVLQEYGFLAEMCVGEEFRDTGVGHELWRALSDWFQNAGINVVQLNVSVKNQRAQKFWAELGFRPFLNVMWKELG